MISTSEKRVYKNTLMLTLRTLVTIPIGFFSVRLSLGMLGAADFGMVGVLSGFTAIALRLSSCIGNSVRRYLCCSMVKDDDLAMRKLVSCSLQIYWVAAVLFVVGLELFGIWMIKYKVRMPVENVSTAIMFYQTVVIGFAIQFLGGAYSSVLTAYEDIHAVAWIGIGEIIVHFMLIVGLYFWGRADLMIWYGVVTVLSFSFTAILNYLVAHRRHGEVVRYLPVRDWKLTRDLLGFTCWQVPSGISASLCGITKGVLLNNYFTSVVNAAQAVGGLISSKISNFGQGFLWASQPRLMKLYAAGEIAEMQALFIRITKFCFFILFMLGVPIFLKIEYVLQIWLKNPPPYSAPFAFLAFAGALMDVTTLPCIAVILATGRIRIPEMVDVVTPWIYLPIVFWGFNAGYGPLTVPVVSLVALSLGFVIRFSFIKWFVPAFSIRKFVYSLIRYYLLPFLVVLPGVWGLRLLFPGMTFYDAVAAGILGILYAGVVIYCLGFSTDERAEVLKWFKGKLSHLFSVV